MRKSLILAAALIGITSASFAQTFNVEIGNVTYAFPAAQMDTVVTDGTTAITVMGRQYDIMEISRMYVDNTTVTDNTVTTSYDGNTAHITVAGNIAAYINATAEGAHVTISQSENVSESTCGEITYILSGESTDGSFYMDGAYKASIELQGLTLHNPSGAAVDIQNGKRIDVSVKKGTENTLSDGTGGTQKGAVVCKGHLEFKGKGTLNVTGGWSRWLGWYGWHGRKLIADYLPGINIRKQLYPL